VKIAVYLLIQSSMTLTPPDTDIYCSLNITLHMIPRNLRFNHQKFAPRIATPIFKIEVFNLVIHSRACQRPPSRCICYVTMHVPLHELICASRSPSESSTSALSQNFTAESVDISDTDSDACEVHLWNGLGDDTTNNFNSGTCSLIQRVHARSVCVL
jgi:hypothetical protein